MTVVLFLTLIFAIFRIVSRVIWLVLTPIAVTHSVFVFLLLCPSVLPALLSLPHPRHRFISGIIASVIFVDLDYLLCFIEVL
jgi:hypothetical protein